MGHTHTAYAADSPFPLYHISVPSRVSLYIGCPWTRQTAEAFNQPLSFDTSSVTNMRDMFNVRIRLRLLPTCTSELGHTHATRAALPSVPSSCHHAFPSVGFPLWTRQSAIAFDQPLSFDTSSVTDMSSMFQVRFRLRLLPVIALPCKLWVTQRCLRYRHTLTLPSQRAILPPI